MLKIVPKLIGILLEPYVNCALCGEMSLAIRWREPIPKNKNNPSVRLCVNLQKTPQSLSPVHEDDGPRCWGSLQSPSPSPCV